LKAAKFRKYMTTLILRNRGLSLFATKSMLFLLVLPLKEFKNG